MSNIKRFASGVARTLPTLVTLAVLAGVGYLGHRTDWKIPSAAVVFGGSEAKEEGWCKDHGVPEATCVVCRGLKVTATPPSAGKKASTAGEPAPAEPPIENGKPRPPVQLPSAEVLRLAGVQTAVSQTRPMTESIEANAEAGYDMTRYAQVSTRAAGNAFAVRVQPGQRITKGQVLALVDSAEAGKAKAEFLQAAAQLAARHSVLERVKTSTAAGFRNQSELVTAEAEVKEAGIRLFNARQALTNLGLPTAALSADAIPAERDVQFLGLPADIVAVLDAERTTANLLPVSSPLDGIVISQSVVPGEIVEPARPLFAVADTSRMWVTADLSLAQMAEVRLGQSLSFLPDGWSGDPFVGKVSWVSTEVNDKTRTVRVRAEVANPEGRLLSHAFGRATIAVRSKPAALVVPEESVQPDGHNSLVIVRLNDEVYRPRVVTLGMRSGGLVEVLSGLALGETVVTTGSSILAAQANRGKLGAGCCAND